MENFKYPNNSKISNREEFNNNNFNNNNNNRNNPLLTSIENLSNNKNLNHFIHRYKFDFDAKDIRGKKIYEQTKIVFYEKNEDYNDTIDNLDDILEANPLEVLEINILTNFINTISEKKIKRTDFTKTGSIDLTFSFFKETSNDMNKLLLSSKLDSYLMYLKNYLKLKKENSTNQSKMNILKEQLLFEKKEYLLMKIKKNKIDKIKEEIKESLNNNNKIKILQNELNKLREKSYTNYNKTENYNRLSKKIENNELIFIKGGDFGISAAFLGTFVITILIIFLKFKIIYTLFIFSVSTAPCFKNLTWTQILSKFSKVLIIELFQLFLLIITSGLAAPFLYYINSFLKYFIDFLLDKTIQKSLELFVGGKYNDNKLEKVFNKEINSLSNLEIKKPFLSDGIKKNLSELSYFLLFDNICRTSIKTTNKEEKKYIFNENNRNVILTDYMYNIKANKEIIEKNGKSFYKLFIIDLISNKKIGYILIHTKLANDFYSLDKEMKKTEILKIKNKKKDYINLGEKKKNKILNTFLSKYSDNREIKNLFYNFYFGLLNKQQKI